MQQMHISRNIWPEYTNSTYILDIYKNGRKVEHLSVFNWEINQLRLEQK